MAKILKPRRISQWGNSTEIIYECPHCGQALTTSVLVQLVHYCFICGKEVDNRVPKHASTRMAKMYHSIKDPNEQKILMESYYKAMQEHYGGETYE